MTTIAFDIEISPIEDNYAYDRKNLGCPVADTAFALSPKSGNFADLSRSPVLGKSTWYMPSPKRKPNHRFMYQGLTLSAPYKMELDSPAKRESKWLQGDRMSTTC